MPNEDYEVLDPLPAQAKESKWMKYGPVIFWGTIVALPAMNLGASFFNYRTARLQVELETLKAAAEKAKDV